MERRKYTKRKRAEQQAETRNRIVDATVALHREVGPLATTVKAIAERAGVERLTVYRHFPDDRALFGACSARFLELRPPPDPDAWQDIGDPVERTRTALTALYVYFRDNQQMLGNVLRDAEKSTALKAHTQGFETFLEAVGDDLARAWSGKGTIWKPYRVTLGHALRFSTWQSLHAQGLDESAMAELVLHWMRGAAGATS